MARQRISFLEKNFDKMLLGLAAAGLLGVVAWQLVGAKNTVQVGNSGELPPGDAWQRVGQMAEKLRGELNTETVTYPEGVTKSDLLERFRKGIAAAVAPVPRLAWAPPMPTLPGMGAIDAINTGVGENRVQLAAMPALSKPVTFAFMTTVHPDDIAAAVAAVPEAAALFPASAPFDVAAVSVEVVLPGAKVRQALETDVDGPQNPAAVPAPRTWWDSIEVLGLELQRERRMPDGSWGEPVTLQTLPGRPTLLPMVQAEVAAGTLSMERVAQLNMQAREGENDIQRPDFYRRAELWGAPVGREWLTPTEALADTGQLSEEMRLTRELRKLEAQAVNIQKAMQLTGPGAGGGNRPPGGGGGGGRPPGGGGGRPGGGGGGAGGDANAEAMRREQQARLDRINAEITRIKERLAALGAKAAEPPRNTGPRDFSPVVTEDVRLWTHDVSAKRGETYRYKLVAQLTNPVYGRGGFLRDQDAELGKRPTMTLASGEWSDPVQVDPESYLFITSAKAPKAGATSALERTTATVDAFQFSWGYWRRGRATLEPGDAVMARVDVPDASKVAEMPAGGTPPPAAPPAGPGPGRGVAPPSGGGGGAGAPAEPAKADVVMPTVEVVIVRDEFLLDVAPVPMSASGAGGVQREQFQAYWRDAAGKVTLRVPETERASALFKRLDESARLGLEQLKAKPEGAGGGDRPPAGPMQPPREPPPSRPPGGGGGGGGGGG